MTILIENFADKRIAEDRKRQMSRAQKIGHRILAPILGTSLAVAGVAEVGVPIVVDSIRTAASNAKQIHESDLLSSYDVADNLPAGIELKDVTIRTVSPSDTSPTQIARDMHAKDVTLVANEISAQVGGPNSLEPGEPYAVAVDQLESPKN